MWKTRSSLLVISLFFISTFMLFSSMNLSLMQLSNNYTYNQISPINLDFNLQSRDYQETEQWIKDGGFDYNISSNWTSSKTGDINDVELNDGPGCANYTVIGDQGTLNYVYDPPQQTNWTMMRDPEFPLFPNETYPGVNPNNIFTIDSAGIFANHSWDETDGDYVGQDPGVMWKRNESTPVNTSDYQITSASISAIFNVSADSSIDRANEGRDGTTWDHVRIFIRISDLNATHTYDIAYYQYDYDNESNSNEYMITVPQENLKFYLTSILEEESNFTITVAINFFCEDNGPGSQDTDIWNYVRVKFINLTFSYQKKINQNTRARWSQETKIFNGRSFIINEAKLYFSYNIDSRWPLNDSPNSEFRIIINDNIHSETRKLSTANTSFGEAKNAGFDVAPLLVKNETIRLSLEVYLADTFILASNLTICIDNVTLNITRTIIEPTETSPPLFVPEGPELAWVMYLLIAIIVGVLTSFGLYQGYFKYPPTIRKIRKLKKNIKKQKAKTPISVSERESVISMNLKNQINSLNLEEYFKQIEQKSMKLKSQGKKGNAKSKLFLLFISFFVILFLTIFSLWNSTLSPAENILLNNGMLNFIQDSHLNLYASDYREYKQWIINPSFNSPISAFWSSSKSGDVTDITLAEDNGYVNYVILGKNRTENYPNNPPNTTDWIMMHDPDHPNFPNETLIGSENAWCWIDENGAFANHSWDEGAGDQIGQDPGVLWKQNVTLPVNVSDYTITSASLSTIINASPYVGGIGSNSPENHDEGQEQGRGDYVKFFVRISDLSGNYTYEVANYINEGENILSDSPMINVTESDLKFYLTSVLQNDGYNFTITMGINFWCEDNEGTDHDEWNYTYIKTLNLEFSYRKNIDQNTRASWSHTTNKLNGREFIINNAKLFFQYRIDSTWPITSPNSEFRIIINNNTHSETKKLSTVTSTFKEANAEGFEVTNLLVKNQTIQIALEVYLADDFIIGDNVTISIDNVRLYISRTILKEVEIPPYNPSGMDWIPIIILLFGVLTGLSVAIGSYQLYFKYPPTVRKIRKLKKDIINRKAKKPILIKNRDIIVSSYLQNQLESIGFEKISKTFEVDKSK